MWGGQMTRRPLGKCEGLTLKRLPRGCKYESLNICRGGANLADGTGYRDTQSEVSASFVIGRAECSASTPPAGRDVEGVRVQTTPRPLDTGC